jgi:hypothetical protein
MEPMHVTSQLTISLATDMRDEFLFGMTTDKTIADTEHVKIPRVVVYTKFEEEKNVLEFSGNHETRCGL